MGILLLASRSPRRAALLAEAGLAFVAVGPGPEPEPQMGETPEAFCLRAAEAKARSADAAGRSGRLLAVDTVVAVEGRILGKPADRAEAARFLALLEGRTHEVLTAHALAEVVAGRVGAPRLLLARSRVACERLDEARRQTWLDTGDWRDKAGGYGIQSPATDFVHLVDGDLDTVVGLSLATLRVLLDPDPTG